MPFVSVFWIPHKAKSPIPDKSCVSLWLCTELVAEKKAGVSPTMSDNGMDSRHPMPCHKDHQPFPLHLPPGDIICCSCSLGKHRSGEERAELVSKAVMGRGHAGGAAARWALLSLLGLGMLTAAAAIDELALNSLSSSDARTI